MGQLAFATSQKFADGKQKSRTKVENSGNNCLKNTVYASKGVVVPQVVVSFSCVSIEEIATALAGS